MSKMKIVAGMGCIDDYENFALAGAHELFGGYVPLDYMLIQGRNKPLNRREVIYYNVQLGSASELMILKEMIDDYGVSVSIAFNAVAMDDAEREAIIAIINSCKEIGYRRFILADYELIKSLKDDSDIEIEVSGEIGEINHGFKDILEQKNVKRLIFPRQTTIDEMKSVIDSVNNKDMEYEAFLLNEKCHFTGAYCSSIHCDELCHICKVPYRISNIRTGLIETAEPSKSDSFAGLGGSGCGLCALWKLSKAGITHLKIVSRGNYTEDTVSDIKAVKEALTILDDSANEEEFVQEMKAGLFPKGCSNNCYYKLV